MKLIPYILNWCAFILFICFVNGNIHFQSIPIPPLGKLINPFDGLWTSSTSHENQNAFITSSHINDEIVIYYDERRVPHIFAENLEDALFAQGYIEAQNRLFQMDFLARAAEGTLSEVLGPKTISIDLERRRRGMVFAAENTVQDWEKSPNYPYLQKYIDGVNAYISSLNIKDYPLEYKLLNCAPRTWDAYKTALITKNMALTLAGRDYDLEYSNLKNALGDSLFHLLYPERERNETPVVHDPDLSFDPIKVIQPSTEDASIKEPILHTFFDNRNKNAGSNSWAVSGQKSITGHPIFCNDPHLALSLPSIWFEVHIHTPLFNSYGVSIPGFPGIMIGYNDFVAWGETNVGQDIEDLFLIKWSSQNRDKYILDNKEISPTPRIHTIKVKGQKDIIDTVLYTYWGPIYKKSNDAQHDLALRWLAHDPPGADDFMVFIDAMQSKNIHDHLKSSERFITPAQNFGCADRFDNIALRVNGKFPVKYNQDGRFIEYGDNSKNNWLAYYPREHNPTSTNPRREFIASANQVSADKNFPYYFTGKFERYRNRSVHDQLSTNHKFSVEDMKTMQYNATSLKAFDFISQVLPAVDSSALNEQGMTQLKALTAWNSEYLSASEEAVRFDLFSIAIRDLVWDEIQKLSDDMDITYPESWRLIELIHTQPNHPIFDITSTAQRIETAGIVIAKALNESGSQFSKLKLDGKSVQWGTYKPLDIHHLMRIPALSVQNLAVDGCPDAINAIGVGFGPSWRMIISLEDKTVGYGVYPGGQSGHPCSKYYLNFIDDWIKGEYHILHNPQHPSEIKTVSQKIRITSPSS